MQLIWDNTYSTGHADIDVQHQTIFTYLNDLERHIQKHKTQDWAADFIHSLNLYIRNHFSFEEMCMRKTKCSTAARNKTQHQKLLSTLATFEQELEANGYKPEQLEKLHTFLSHWYIHHTLRIDIQLRDCI